MKTTNDITEDYFNEDNEVLDLALEAVFDQQTQEDIQINSNNTNVPSFEISEKVYKKIEALQSFRCCTKKCTQRFSDSDTLRKLLNDIGNLNQRERINMIMTIISLDAKVRNIRSKTVYRIPFYSTVCVKLFTFIFGISNKPIRRCLKYIKENQRFVLPEHGNKGNQNSKKKKD